jgi:hypothetical protein
LVRAFVAAAAVSFFGPARAPAAPAEAPPPKVRYTFDGSVVRTVAVDSDRDGVEDHFATYERGKLLRVELDRDNDGEVDERQSFDHRPDRHHWQVQVVDGRRRIVPALGHAGGSGTIGVPRPFPPPKTERLVDGRWTGTFNRRDTYVVQGPDDGPAEVTSSVEYKDGLPVYTESDGAGRYARHEYKDGKLVRLLEGHGRDRLTEVGYLADDGGGGGGAFIREYDRDADGNPESRSVIPPQGSPDPVRQEKPVKPAGPAPVGAGGWTGDFEETERYSSDGRAQTRRTVYRGGVARLKETTDDATGHVTRRETFGADGSYESEEDIDLDGRADLRRTHRPGDSASTWRLVGGVWTGDFEVTDAGGSTSAYRDGRVVRYQWATAPGSGDPAKSWDHPVPEQTIESLGGKPYHWYFRSPQTGALVREHFDTDGDGEADVFVDWVNLSVDEKPPPG